MDSTAIGAHAAEAAAPPATAAAGNAEVRRRRLLDRLAAEPRPRLIALQGPAGYGKTVLLRQYCEQRAAAGEAVSWLRLDRQSADAAEFLRLLCEATVRLAQPAARARRERARRSTIQDFARALERAATPATIALDNFEVAGGPDVEEVFVQAVRALPPGVQLCVATRALPAKWLARLQLREQVLLLGHEDLAFRMAETAQFFAEFPDLRRGEVAEIHDRTEGWPAALQGFRLCLRRGGRYRAAAFTGRGGTHELIDSLADEMFETLGAPLRALLLRLSIAEKLDARLVAHLGGGDGAARLAEIERAGLFLARIDLDGSWFRFHHLFRRFLLARAAAEVPETELRRRHRSVARWYAGHGYREDAIHHALCAGDGAEAAALLAGEIDTLISQERLGLVERYVDQLPPETVLADEALLNGAIIAYAFRRAFDKAARLLDLYRARLEAAGRGADWALHTFCRTFLFAAQDRIEEMNRSAALCADQLTERGGYKYAITCNARAMALVGAGQYEEARSLLLQARPLHDRDHHLFGQAYQEAIYSMTLSAQARIDDAVRGLAAALQRTEEQACGSIGAGAVIAACLASGRYEQNALADAEALIRDYAQLAEQQTIVDPMATMLLTRARIAHLQGARAEAEEALERALYLGYRHSLERLVGYAHAELARQATFDGDHEQAAKWLRELPPAWTATPAEGLLFHAGEAEACTVTYARHLIHAGEHARARRLLGAELQRARQQRRRRRELKLGILLAVAQHAGGAAGLARRSLLEALELGAAGGFVRSFLDERQPLLGLLKELRASLDGLPRLAGPDPALAHLDRLLRESGESTPAPPAGEPDLRGLIESLSHKERRILHFIAAGLSNKELAHRLSVSPNTVKWHLRNIFEKLQARNRMQAIALLRRFGAID